jgi:branched-chain amino acid transport system substrate-binding protein
MTRRRSTAAFIALTAAALLAVGCSNSVGSSGSGGTKSPIRLMVDTTMTPAASLGGLSFPWGAYGAKAAAAALNAKGGIDGHPVQIDVCDNQGNPNQSAACARTAKSSGDIAVIGAWDILGATQLLPVLQAEGIPDVGPIAVSTAEVSNPDAFSFDTGAIMSGYASAGLFPQQGCKNVVQFLPTTPATQQTLAGEKAIVADRYRLQDVVVPPGQASVAALASTALSTQPDCIGYEGDGQTNVKIIAALRQAGFKGKYITAMGSLQPPFLKSLGKLGNGVIAMSTAVDPTSSDPGVAAFRSQMTAYAGGASAAADLNENAQGAWSSVQLVDQALAGSGRYTSAELLKKLPTMCDVNVGNVYPHVNFCKPVASSTLFPRVFNDNWRLYVGQNGVYVPLDDQWHDFASTIPAGA